MKIKLLALLLSCFSFYFFANGQIEKKSILLGGEVSYYNSNIDYSGSQPNQKYMNANFGISVGKAFSENNVFGLNLTYAPSSIDNYYYGPNYAKSKGNQYTFGVFNRKYKKLARDFYFFAEFRASYTYFEQRGYDTVGVKLETMTQSGGQLSLTPGLSYKIFDKLHLEIIISNIISMKYAVSKDQTLTASAKHSEFQFNTSLNSTGGLSFLGVGIHFIL